MIFLDIFFCSFPLREYPFFSLSFLSSSSNVLLPPLPTELKNSLPPTSRRTPPSNSSRRHPFRAEGGGKEEGEGGRGKEEGEEGTAFNTLQHLLVSKWYFQAHDPEQLLSREYEEAAHQCHKHINLITKNSKKQTRFTINLITIYFQTLQFH